MTRTLSLATVFLIALSSLGWAGPSTNGADQAHKHHSSSDHSNS